jgi:hypothetical protein
MLSGAKHLAPHERKSLRFLAALGMTATDDYFTPSQPVRPGR